MKRYNLSGIYIFDQFEGEERRQPTCIEDLKRRDYNNYKKFKKGE